jgi:S1-C subfamily serine protease
MSVDSPEPEAVKDADPAPVPRADQIALRREALLPSERGRGLGTVAVVCTMAGVASGLALATTLMAMQVADSMAVRPTIHFVQTDSRPAEIDLDNGFLGIYYLCRESVCQIHKIAPNTPAAVIGLRSGDRLISIDGDIMTMDSQVQSHITGAHPGTDVTLVIERDGTEQTVHAVLASRPARRL